MPKCSQTETLIERALRDCIQTGRLSYDLFVSILGTFAVCALNTTHFSWRDVVRVPLGEGGISFGNVLLQTTGDRMEGFVAL